MKIILRNLSIVILLFGLSVSAYSGIVTGNAVYGIKSGDSVTRVRAQAKKYKFRIVQEPVNSEAGEETGFHLYRDKQLILIAVVLQKRVHWVDFLEKDVNYNGIIIGSKVTDYLNEKFDVAFYESRDCSLDDIVVIINGVKALIGSENWKVVSEYKTKKDPKVLEGVVIKGVELEKLNRAE